MVVGVHVTVTDVMVLAGACTLTDAVPDTAVFCTLAAVTVTVEAVDGAVKAPFAVIVPALADHVTAEL
jgi:hypothetical protein